MASLYLLAAASPGPNFFILSQLSLSGRRRLGVRVALGIASGSTIWALLAMAGVASLLTRVEWLYTSIRLAGALYLIWLGGKLAWAAFRPASGALAQDYPLPSSGKAFRMGVLTSLTNPKSGAFWTSVFASVFPAAAPSWLFVATAVMIAGLSTCWHLGIVIVLASEQAQTCYQKLRRPMDAICGVLLVGLGAKLALGR